MSARARGKHEKDFAAADAAAAKLQALDVCYIDSKREWYTRPVLSEEQKTRKQAEHEAERAKGAARKKAKADFKAGQQQKQQQPSRGTKRGREAPASGSTPATVCAAASRSSGGAGAEKVGVNEGTERKAKKEKKEKKEKKAKKEKKK